MNNIEFKNIITPIMDVSKRLSEFEEDEQLFLTTIKNLDSDYLERMKIKYKKDAIDLKGGLKPVNFLRYIIVDKILKKDIINIETINQFKELIRNKDVSLLTNYSDYKDAINKFGEKDSFKVWSNFRILFYIYYNKYKDEGIINSNLSEIIKILQESLDLENTNISINEFDWNQNFGTSKSWIALYPKNIKKHKDAYQIFMSFENNKIKYGLYPGYNLSGKKILILSDFNSINYLDIINYFKSNIIPKYIEFNKNIKKSNMSKNVKSEQENTELIFNAAKLLKDKKQIILYGPPGTGKTWNTKRIIEKFATEEYDDLKKEGRVEFITFHQSYAYEEFIEGIKPELEPENDNITYNIKPGVFKKICNDIEANFKSNKIEFEISKDANIFKLSLGNTLDKEDNPIYDFCKNKNVIALGWGQNIDFTNANSKKEIEKMIIEKYGRLGGPNESNSPFSIIAINYFKNKMKINDYVLISNGNKKLRAIGKIIGDYEYHDDYDIEYTHFRKIKWVNVDLDVDIKNINKSYFSQMTIYELNRENLYNIEKQVGNKKRIYNLSKEERKQLFENAKPYFLIIDEINRGNISKIFGELITLLEKDKRLGNDNEIITFLPYSSKPFGIPSNLYIIGTMNTADRSITNLDIALRRRFGFIQVLPNSKRIKKPLSDSNINLRFLLDELNKRIELILDKDHLIGHSYFMGLENKNLSFLKDRWFNEIIPLLQEYFYNDWKKLGFVIGKGFIIKNTYDNVLEDESFIYEIKKYDDENNNDFEKNIKKIIDNPKNLKSDKEKGVNND